MTDDDPAFHESRAYDGEDTTEPCPQCGSTDFWRDPNDSSHFYCGKCKYNWGGGDMMTEPYTAVDIAWLAAEEASTSEPDPRTLRLIATVREEQRSRGFWKEAHDTACSVLDERKATIAMLEAERDEAWNLVRDREAQQRLDRGQLAEAEAEVARLRGMLEEVGYPVPGRRTALATPGEREEAQR